MQCLLRESCSHKQTNQQRKMIDPFLHNAGQRSACYKYEYNNRRSCCCGCHRCVCVCVCARVSERACENKPNIARIFSLEPSQVHVCLFHVTTGKISRPIHTKINQNLNANSKHTVQTALFPKRTNCKNTKKKQRKCTFTLRIWLKKKKIKVFVLYIYIFPGHQRHWFLMKKNCYALVLSCNCSTWPGPCDSLHTVLK